MLDILQERIEQGYYPLGKRLPSERKLAREFDVPQSQIHRKLQELVASGLLECYRNNGYFIRAGKPAAEKLNKIALCWENTGINANEDFYVGMLLNLAPEYKQNITLFNMPRTENAQNDLFNYLIHENFAGIYCYPHFIKGFLPAFEDILNYKIPLIFWDYSPLPGVFPSVGIDHFRSSLLAAEIIAGQKKDVTYIGFKGTEQHRLKHLGFQAGCRHHRVNIAEEIFFPFESVFNSSSIDLDGKLLPGKLYFTSTRLLSTLLVGKMFDMGFGPGKDYTLLTMDRIKFIDSGSLQLDSLMRDNMQVIHKLLKEMCRAIDNGNMLCHDWRYMMKYIPGSSLIH